ncbi:efflux transporter outer membrane subunit [Legionella lytica]|nr:efflux transporter outer membrane subunit [Legionella lytica]
MPGFRSRPGVFMGLLTLSVLQAGCMVGPNFRSPPLPPVKQYTESPLPAKTVKTRGIGGEAQAFIKNKDIPLLWWELYQSSEINQLVKAGLDNSPTLASASAALHQARENWRAQVGNLLLPAINGAFGVQRQRYATAQIGTPGQSSTFSIYSTAFNVSYVLDVFGGSRRELESLRAQVDYQQFEEIAAHLTLAANIVTTAVNIASYQAQIDATRRLIKIEQDLLNILNSQFNVGAVSRADVLTQQTLLEQSKATLPPLQKNLALARHSLSVLVGEFPEGALPKLDLNRLKLPTELPLSIPSMLVRQRPDVRAAEALLHSACAKVGVATANLFPQVSLSGNEGWLNISWSKLFTGPNNVWLIGAAVAQPLFRGGALFAQRRAAIAAYDQAKAQYQQTVLQAFQNVADALSAIETDARTLQADIRAEDAAHDALKLTVQQFRLGGVSYINLLNAQQQYQQAMLSRIQAQALRYNDTAGLFQALGGGWWHKPWCVKECV